MESIVLTGISIAELASAVVEQLRKEFPLQKGAPYEEYLTIKEVSHLLKVSRVTLNKWEKKGILTPSRIDGSVRYLRTSIDKKLKSLNT